MRLLFLTETIPYPLDSGGRIKSYHTLRILSRRHEVHCHAFIREPAQRTHAGQLASHCRTVTLHLRPRSRFRDLRAFVESHAARLPFTVWRHFDHATLETLRTAARQLNFDAVYCDHLSMLEYGRRLGLPIVFDAHNVEFEIVKRHAETLGLSPLRAVAAIEWRRLQRYERLLYKGCQLIYAVSDVDAHAIQRLCGGDVPTVVVPIALDARALTPVASLTDDPELLFVGGCHWPPNADAVAFFVDRILPIVQASLPAVRLTIVGRTTPEVTRRFGGRQGVTLAGHVPSVEPYFANARVMVVPIRAGSGMRVKILDALARGVPVVTTTIGFEGIDAEPGVHLLVGDAPETFAAAVVRLLTDRSLACALSRAGRNLAVSKYDESAVSQTILGALDRLGRYYSPN